MKTINWFLSLMVFCTLSSLTTLAATNHVWQDSVNPAPPYTNWATAAHTIQEAVDAANVGDTVLVTDGVYALISVNRQVTLTSVNGPAATLVDGGGINRCVWLGASAILSGFTLTNGNADAGGGVWCESTNALVTNCVLTGNSTEWGGGGGAASGTLNNCTLTGNSAYEGGGAHFSTLNNCTITDNSAKSGGGVYGGSLTNCTLTGNSALYIAGGAYLGTLNHCTLTGNSATEGGGAYQGTLDNCILTSNSASGSGGGACYGTLDNCILTSNSASGFGGGACYGTLDNCILTSNSASGFGGGAYDSTVYNSTLIGNSAFYQGGGSYGGALNNCTLTGNSTLYGGGGAYSGTLSNCTLAANSTLSVGGGAASCTLANCTLTSNSASGSGGGAYYSVLYNCTLSGNSASEGGGSYGGALNNCTLTDNSASQFGGGASETTLYNCTLTGNSAGGGGGASGGTLNNCTLTGNSAGDGGGANRSTLNNSTLTYNLATNSGGGTYSGTLNTCTLSGNSAVDGGGAYTGILINCTLTRNSASGSGGGAYSGTLNNCIVYFNTATTNANYKFGFLNYCCTTPLPSSGISNLTFDPKLASASRLSAGSPCRGTGSADYATGTDIDGEPWANPPSIGCDEFWPGSNTGPLSVSIEAAFTKVAPTFMLDLTGLIDGRATASVWDFGDGVVVSNQPYTSHAWATEGDYAVVLRVYNDSHPEGISATQRVHVVDIVHYVAVISTNPTPPYNSWETAATNIQDAVDAATVPGALVLVSNGVYSSGGRAVGTNVLVNRVAVDKPLTLRSVNGPELTVIQGYQVPGTTNGDGAIRCAYLTNGASLSGFTLTNGATRSNGDWYLLQSGGGVWCATAGAIVSNCVLTGNSAKQHGGGAYNCTLHDCTLTGNSANSGGGAYQGTLTNCTLTGNSAKQDGGGAYDGTLNNCTLSGNAASHGGGAYRGTLTNCTLTGNSAKNYGGGASGDYSHPCALNNCTLSGNAASDGGGAYRGTLTNCTLRGNSAGSGGGASDGTLNNCTLTANAASQYGGGAYGAVLNECTLTGNASGNRGGGAYQGTLYNCVLTSNSASGSGGGTYDSTIYNSTLIGNSAFYQGGGAYQGTLNHCTLNGNSAHSGGGVFGGTLNNCTLTGNAAPESGGGASGGTLDNCTLTGNSAGDGGGVYSATLNNCIVCFNTGAESPNCDSGCTLRFCCTTSPAFGISNITLDPQLASASHLSANSPCRGRGSAAYATGTDMDGEPWGNPPSIGCDEFWPGSNTGPLSVSIGAAFTKVAPTITVDLTGLIEGRATASVWDFGDGVVVSNQPYTSHAWATEGDYAVVLRVYNDSHPEGISATQMVHVVARPVHYVAVNSSNPTLPYSSWETAATNIQDAVDAATVPGACVLVTNGVYATGGKAVYGTMTNRVAIYRPLTVRSINGPTNTIIQGYQVPGTTNGDGAIRCVYLTNGAVLSGFTLTKGATRTFGDNYHREDSGGGVWCDSTNALVANCTLTGNSASHGGGAYRGTLTNCTLTGNSAKQDGGGASGDYSHPCTLNNCTLSGNSASYGGGAYQATLDNCGLTGNSASQYGGGACDGTLTNCTLTGNSASYQGGGAAGATLNNCTVTGNSAFYQGGGAAGATLNNCTVTGNSAFYQGGGVFGGTLSNCTLTGNSAYSGGGASEDELTPCKLNNCIVCFNTGAESPNSDSGCTLRFCCTTSPAFGISNITLDPQLASASHLSANSPCRGRGSAAYATGTDMDGEPWGNPPSIGCDEFWPGSNTGPLSVSIGAAFTKVAPTITVDLTGLIEGRAATSVWDFGDGVVVSNRPYTSHAWTTEGDYAVVLRAYNDNHPEGISATQMVHVVAQVYYVSQGSANPAPPYNSWDTAATNIQDAVDAASAGDVVLVTTGVYATGGRAVYGTTTTNRVAVYKPLTVRSLNGPASTIIQGHQVPDLTNGEGAIRCVYLTNGAVLSGFTLTKGATRTFRDAYHREDSGGGVWCEPTNAMVTNCALTGNSACWSGGGAYNGTLDDCTLTGNSASQYGGGAYFGTLFNCVLTGNSGNSGGGAYQGTLNNCILSGNLANSGGGAAWSALNYCTLTANTASEGGGTVGGTLNNCILTRNSASGSGGGAYSGAVNNCTLVDNIAADSGGGASYASLNNCIVCYNVAWYGANYWEASLNYCCTTPLPTYGVGNITSEPLFVDRANGNLRLQSNSPCINAGDNSHVTTFTDLDSNPRNVSGTVDIGAYEYKGTGSSISYAWLQQYGLPTDVSVDTADADSDGQNNWQEWQSDTNPNDANSLLRLTVSPNTSHVAVTFPSSAARLYTLLCCTNLTPSSVWTPVPGQTDLPGTGDVLTLTDANPATPAFYRVSVRLR